ncbi:hypothetical protein SAMD00019534_000030 [Acytostelium subglobosum LB1]|uniref:hypothetical protein n=1 Tax=Acytostelium subglobosum LB1 TaxID=1410327 RepID=UPI0006449129|nr:hypothetical protein SAMD00019534_000030 [Acytostelium subglobosum LB1]GAM16828.1 hypothetical protein SAMD00019534_000030 [Acytostelium subglobosum LB1]|eukprot:XP_012758890.1 hypothetical protein SAMD00019534_000030 [Acytostelium subglobosum LB1]
MKKQLKVMDDRHNMSAKADLPLEEVAKIKFDTKTPDAVWKERARAIGLNTKTYSLHNIRGEMERIANSQLDLVRTPNGYHNPLAKTLKLAIDTDTVHLDSMKESRLPFENSALLGSAQDATQGMSPENPIDKDVRIIFDGAKMNKNNRNPTEIGALQIIDPLKTVSRLKSPDDGVMFLSFTGAETTKSLRENLEPLKNDLELLHRSDNIWKINDKYYRFSIMYTLDLACIASLLGMCDVFKSNSTYRCTHCHCTNHTINCVLANDMFTLRTLETITEDADKIKAALERGSRRYRQNCSMDWMMFLP